jgi:2-polyprenyl-3-methyl-5-hydroxy-6-metoxy-1,4-benzoquinol methylase
VILGKRYRLGERLPRKLSEQKASMVHSINRKIQQGTYALEPVACCICGRADAEPLSERDRHGVQCAVVICRGCGLVRTDPRPTASTYDQYYAAEYYSLEYDQREPGEAFFLAQRERGRGIFAFLARAGSLPAPGGRVLEVGCSSGGILHAFRERGYAVRGVDTSEAFTAYGRSRHGLDLAVGTLAQVAADWRPDLVIYSHTLEHVLDPAAELAAVRALLAPAGLLYVQVPGIKALRRAYRMSFLAYIQFAHVHHFSLATLTNLLAKHAFDRVAGDETVHAVFRPSLAPTAPAPANDYDATMACLKRAERAWPLYRALHAAGRVLRRVAGAR